MKTTLALALLLMSGSVVVRAEPEKASTPPANAEFVAVKVSAATNTATNAPAGSPALQEQKLQKQGESVGRPELITRAPPSKTRGVFELFNPFAPAAPQPQSRWVERSDWGTTASQTGSMTPVEVRHEARFGIVAARR